MRLFSSVLFALIFVFYLRFFLFSFHSICTYFLLHLHLLFCTYPDKIREMDHLNLHQPLEDKGNFFQPNFYTKNTYYDFDRLSKIPKFFLNFSLTQNEHEISALLDLPSSPTSPMDVMDLNPFRYFIGSCL